MNKRSAKLASAAGRVLRQALRRSEQGLWSPAAHRPEPVEFLKDANHGRIQHLLALKWQRMAASPFGFFRGAAPLMAADLAPWPTTGLHVQLCGDAHVLNLGAYAAPDGHLVFDINDFDETICGPWEWDVKRLAASVLLANQATTGRTQAGRRVAARLVRSYRQAMRRFARLNTLDLLRYEVQIQPRFKIVQRVMDDAAQVTPRRVLQKLTESNRHGKPRFHDNLPTLKHVPRKEADAVLASLTPYRETLGADRAQVLEFYHPVDVAFKVVGTGSVGTRDYIVLLLGRDRDDPLFLQVKEELPSCWRGSLSPVASYPHQGRRVAEGQHRLQTQTDAFVGWTTIGESHYLVRQLADHKASVDPGQLSGENLEEYGRVAGEILAKAHARSGVAEAIGDYAGDGQALDEAIADFAVSYMKQTIRDHAALVASLKGQKPR